MSRRLAAAGLPAGDFAAVVTAVRVAAAHVWSACRAYEDAVDAEATALVAVVEAARHGDDAELATARAVLTETLRRRDQAAARLGVTGPGAFAPQLLGLLAAGRAEEPGEVCVLCADPVDPAHTAGVVDCGDGPEHPDCHDTYEHAAADGPEVSW